MKLPFSGGCACGAVRYECSAKPAFSWKCHCTDCQRASGGAYCPVMYVPKSALTVSGNAKYSRVTAESGRWVDRGICSNCGSNLFILAALVPDLQGIWAGSLHDVNNFEPQVHVWTRSAPSWSSLSADLKKIAVAPNEAEFKALLADVAEAV